MLIPNSPKNGAYLPNDLKFLSGAMPPYPKPKLKLTQPILRPQPFLPPHSPSPDHLAPTSSHPILSPIHPPPHFIPPITPHLPHIPSSITTPLNQTLTLTPIHSTITPRAPILSTDHILSISMINADQNRPTLLPPHLPHPMNHTQHYQPGVEHLPKPTSTCTAPNLIQLSLTFIGSSLQGICLGTLFHCTQHSWSGPRAFRLRYKTETLYKSCKKICTNYI